MARKGFSGSGLIFIGIFVIIAMITKYWQLIVMIGGLALIIWLVVKMMKHSSATDTQASTTTPEKFLDTTATPPLPQTGLSTYGVTQISAKCAFCGTIGSHRLLRETETSTDYQCVTCGKNFYVSKSGGTQNLRVSIQVRHDDFSVYGGGALHNNSASPDSMWVPQGRTIAKNGLTIPGGLIYCGKGLKTVSGWNTEPALLDLSLKVDWSNPDRSGSKMDYWPSFSQMHPTSRAAFIEWLTTGKKDLNANIGYVFVYFYGLERRVLADARNSSAAQNEIPAIIAEAKRLLSIYGGNHSFRGYASSFIDLLQSTEIIDRLYKSPPAYSLPCYDIPLSIKAGLSQMAADGVPLAAEWAFAWVETDPMTSLRTPAQRCREEFKKLFCVRYTEKFGDGCKLKVNKTKLTMTYRPASSSFGGTLSIPFNDLFDATVLKEPISTLRDLVESCTNELDAYSRYLGRNAGTKESLEATALLPQPLLNAHGGEEFKSLSRWLKGVMISESPVQMELDKLLGYISSIKKESFGKREATALAQLLAKIGIGIEPDTRFGNQVPKLGQDVLLFNLSDNAPSSPSKEYSAATILMHLAVAVASADGTIAPEEKRLLEEHLEEWLHLSTDERTRLNAHTQWLITLFPGLNGIKKRLELLNVSQKESIGKFLVSVAQADGYIDPTEIKILTRIYELLGLDVQNLYSHAHKAAVDPVTVQSADIVKQDYAIPAHSVIKPAEGIVLDMSSVEAKLAETVAVSALLNNIFTDDEPGLVQQTQVQESTDTAVIPGLDSETFAFMQILAAKLVWAREELENLAAESSLMLDGTLDSINDAAYDHFGGPFFEGDDPIEINAAFAKEIAA